MFFSDFSKIYKEILESKPSLLKSSNLERAISSKEIAKLEEELDLALNESYKKFLGNYGGGYFHYTIIFSGDKSGYFYLPKMLEDATSYLPKGFLPFSDDECGGNYLFKIEGKSISEEIYYWNTDGGLVSTDYSNLFDFLLDTAFI